MKKQAATIGLGAFLLADIVLVALALRPPAVIDSGADVASGTSRPVSTADATPTTQTGFTTSTSSAAPTATASTSKAPTATRPVPVQRLVVGVDARTAWRATAGSCAAGGALVQATTDGGATWTKGTSPARAIARIQPLLAGNGFILGARADCAVGEWTTRDNGATWVGPQQLSGAWARQLSEPNQIITPADAAAEPCGDLTVLDLSRTSAEQAEALCQDGSVKVTNDAGASWDDSGEASGAVALGNRLEGTILTTYAARVVSACAGVQVVKVIVGKPAGPVACVKTAVPAEPGQIGISVSATAGWLVVGDETWTAGADLKVWKQA